MNKIAFIFKRLVCVCTLLFVANVATYAYASPKSSSDLDAENHIKVKYQKSLSMEISSKGINHISFWPFRIEKIIGDSSMFTANTGENTSGSELFITSKLASGSKINLSIVLTNNRVVDLALNIKESVDPKIIDLDFGTSLDSDEEIDHLVSNMIDAMRNSVIGKYYVSYTKKPIILAETKAYKIKQISNYRYGKLFGAVLVIQNKRKGTIFIKPNDFVSHFSDVDAYAIASEMILGKGSTSAYVVFRRRDE